MENTQESLSDKEQSEENRRITFIQRQLTPLLAAISIVSLPSSDDENENSDSADENSEMDQAKIMTTDTSAEAEMDWTKEATTQDNCTRDNCMRERMLFLEQKKRKKAEAQIAKAESLEFTDGDKEYFNQL